MNASSEAAGKPGITTYLVNANAAVVIDGKSYKPLKSVVIDSSSVFPSSADISIDQGTLMGNAIYDTISDTGYGILMNITEYPDSDGAGALGMNVAFKKGRQLTSGETGVFFGKAYNNVDDMSYTLDESAEK